MVDEPENRNQEFQSEEDEEEEEEKSTSLKVRMTEGRHDDQVHAGRLRTKVALKCMTSGGMKTLSSQSVTTCIRGLNLPLLHKIQSGLTLTKTATPTSDPRVPVTLPSISSSPLTNIVICRDKKKKRIYGFSFSLS